MNIFSSDKRVKLSDTFMLHCSRVSFNYNTSMINTLPDKDIWRVKMADKILQLYWINSIYNPKDCYYKRIKKDMPI